MGHDMSTAPLRQMGSRVHAGLHAFTLRAVPLFIANQGALLPTVVMASVMMGSDMLKGLCPARAASNP